MDNTTLNREYLESLNACQDAITFVEQNNLVGFPLDRLGEIKGDYEDYVSWLKTELEIVREYNSEGLMTRMVTPDGREFRWEYDSNGNFTLQVYPDGSETRYEYDSNGNMTLEVYPDGSESRFEYDSNGNMTLRVYPNGREISTPTEYYDNGQLKSIGDLTIPRF